MTQQTLIRLLLILNYNQDKSSASALKWFRCFSSLLALLKYIIQLLKQLLKVIKKKAQFHKTHNVTLFNYSFILDISMAPLEVHYYSEALQTTALILCRS